MILLLAACEENHRQADHASAPVVQCGADGAKMKGDVTSISAVIDRVNALPHPTSGACLVASLPRPLQVVATTGVTSAQPAGGPHEPRLFLINSGVVISVVPKSDPVDGGSGNHGADFIEMGEWTSASRTIKAEIALPVADTLPADEPFTRLEDKMVLVTPCGICHTGESPHPTTAHAYVSKAYRPRDEVTLDGLRAEHTACVDSGVESERCDMFHALFDFGSVTQGRFSEDVAYFQ